MTNEFIDNLNKLQTQHENTTCKRGEYKYCSQCPVMKIIEDHFEKEIFNILNEYTSTTLFDYTAIENRIKLLLPEHFRKVYWDPFMSSRWIYGKLNELVWECDNRKNYPSLKKSTPSLDKIGCDFYWKDTDTDTINVIQIKSGKSNYGVIYKLQTGDINKWKKVFNGKCKNVNYIMYTVITNFAQFRYEHGDYKVKPFYPSQLARCSSYKKIFEERIEVI